MKFTRRNAVRFFFFNLFRNKPGADYIQPQSQIFGVSETSGTLKGHKRIIRTLSFISTKKLCLLTCRMSPGHEFPCYLALRHRWVDFALSRNLQGRRCTVSTAGSSRSKQQLVKFCLLSMSLYHGENHGCSVPLTHLSSQT